MRSVIVACCVTIGACRIDDAAVSGVNDGTTNRSAPVPVNTAPVISGAPSDAVTAGQLYEFKPSAADPDGDGLTFTVTNKPFWAGFDASTGQLSGRPAENHVGRYSDVTISVTDGNASASLPPFTVLVAAPQPTVSVPPSTTPSSPTDSAASTTSLAQRYPGDVGIASDSAIVFAESFEQESVDLVAARYNDVANQPGLALVGDKPAASTGSRALQFTAGGSVPSAHLYRRLAVGREEIYLRYYVKYVGAGPWHHSGIWVGGYNPPLDYPSPNAGKKPKGDDRFSVGFEPMSSESNARMDFYAYWMKMHSWKDSPTDSMPDEYWGNTILHRRDVSSNSDSWTCYELHLRLNSDLDSGAGAVLELWREDTLVRRYDDKGPLGTWVRDKFCADDANAASCTDFLGNSGKKSEILEQRWRKTTDLRINYIWLQNYNSSRAHSRMLLDDIVVATQRVGCTRQK